MKYNNRNRRRARRRRRRRKDEEEEVLTDDWLSQGVLPPILYPLYILLTIPTIAHCLLSKLDIDSLQVFATCFPWLRPNIIQWLQPIVERNNTGDVLEAIFTRFPSLHCNYSQKEYKMLLKRVHESYHEDFRNGLVPYIISAVTDYIACLVTRGRITIWFDWREEIAHVDAARKKKIMRANLEDLNLKSRTFYHFQQFLTGYCKNLVVANNSIDLHCTSIRLEVTIPRHPIMHKRVIPYFTVVIHILDKTATPELYNYLEEKLREEYSVAAAAEPTLTHPKVKVF